MMWLKKAMGLEDMKRPDPTMTNPVGWSSIHPPQVVTNQPATGFRELSESRLPGAERPLFKDELEAARNYSLKLFEDASNAAGMSAGAGGGSAARMLASRRAIPKPPPSPRAVGKALAEPQGIRAFHGSPHTFDKFDMGKLGAGEGGQAYGRGLYFAGKEQTAKTYRNLTQGMASVDDVILTPNDPPDIRRMANLVLSGEDIPTLQRQAQLGLDAMTRRAAELQSAYKADPKNPLIAEEIPMVEAARVRAANELRVLDQLKGKKIDRPKGSMYEVNLRTSPDRLLDWDKPLAQQPKAVQEAFAAGSGRRPADIEAITKAGVPISDPMISRQLNNPDAVAALRKSGIDGIQYLDQGSRAAGDGSRNYVMFDDALVEILRRYGLLGILGGGAAAQGGDQ